MKIMKIPVFKKHKSGKGDILIPIITAVLCFLGLIFVYSASNYTALSDYGDTYYFVKKQLLGYFLGGVAFLVASKINREFLQKNSFAFFIAGTIMLALVLTPLGREVYGAKRWIGIGGFTIQPSDVAKLTFIFFVSNYFGKDISRANTVKGCLPVLFAGALTCLLIMLQPNMSITMCIGAIMLIMLFISGMPLKKMTLVILPILLAIPLLIVIEPYRLKRLSAFLDPWSSPKGEGYQLLQSLYALGSGGLFGVGIFNSRQKLKFLPFAESDFILSVIGEECGFLGVTILFSIYIFLCSKIIKTAKNTDNFFDYLLCIGVVSAVLIQLIINALVVSGSIPPTGLPLPLISSGNTQIIVFCFAIGLVYGMSKEQTPKGILR